MRGKLILVLILLINSSINSQTILERLDSPDYSVRVDALIEIRDNNLTEYTGKLLERIFEQPRLYLTAFFLDVLFILEYEEISNIIYQFIEVCDNFPQENPLGYKVEASALLIKLEDYHTVGYVFEYININPLNNSEEYISLLKEIALNIPQYSETVKGLLIEIKDNSEFYHKRREAIENLILIYGESNLQNEILSTIVNDSEPDNRGLAMKHYNFSDRRDLLKQQIQNDTYWGLRISYSTELLDEFGEPEDLKFIIDYSLVETDSLVITALTNLIFGFIPQKPDTLNWNELTTRLINYTDEMYGYGWITHIEFKYIYQENLTMIIESIESTGDIETACSIIDDSLLPMIEEDLSMEHITIEAYKFLHYYTVYIKEEMEEEFGECP